MSRIIGAHCKKCRTYGVKLCSKPAGKCALERRRGQRVRGGPPSKLSDYGQQLREKQKTKFIYGLKETQFHNYYKAAVRRKEGTGDVLTRLLENRLDNVIYRLGFAITRPQARQGVNHGRFKVNNKKVDIPSYQVKQGDKISWHERATKSGYLDIIKPHLDSREVPKWLKRDIDNMVGEIVSSPNVTGEELDLNMRMIVEFYSRR